MGSDFAGVVKSTGSHVTEFKAGDRIYGVTPVILKKQGALAQLLAVDRKYARIIPREMSFEEAASLPIAALTALNGLRKCKIGPGTSVLVNGGTGGVGHFGIQIAKAKGAMVTATCSAGNAELAKKLGADETAGYSSEELAKIDRQFDAILDAYGWMNYADVCRLLKRKGIYASTQFKPRMYFSALMVRIIFRKKLTSSNMRSRAEDMSEMEGLFREKKIIPIIENYYSLDNSAEAFELAEHGKPRGKIIVRV
jgi:NADPH:quinone reductase-like Zn-dependent oxidoreductase